MPHNPHLPTILHVVHSMAGGGTERNLLALLQAFNPMRFRHRVLTLRTAGDLSVHLPDHVSMRALDVRDRHRCLGGAIARYCRRHGVSLIHARNTCTWADATLASIWNRRARLILGFHGLDECAEFSRRQRFIAKYAYRAGAAFTTVAHAGRQTLHRQAGIPLDRTHVIPNGVRLDLFNQHARDVRSEMRKALSIAENEYVVGSIGSLTAVKNYEFLLRATGELVKCLPQLRVLIVGDGPLRRQLEESIRRMDLGHAVQLVGSRDDIPAMLAAMDAYVCCSRSEALSTAMLEAMASALPVVTTSVGDHDTIVAEGRNGFTVADDDVDRLVKCLNVLGRYGTRRRAMGLASLQKARQFDFNRTVRAYEEYYASALKGPISQSEKQG